jgi:hypothetical protein
MPNPLQKKCVAEKMCCRKNAMQKKCNAEKCAAENEKMQCRKRKNASAFVQISQESAAKI